MSISDFEKWRASNSGSVIQWTDIWSNTSQEPFKTSYSGLFMIKQPGHFTVTIHKPSDEKPYEIGPNWIETFSGSKHWVQSIS